MGYRRWDTLFELKKDHKRLGLEGWTYFIIDFVQDLNSDDLKYVISYPTFTGLGVGPGISSYVVTEEELNELFKPIEKTFQQYAKELEEDFVSNREC